MVALFEVEAAAAAVEDVVVDGGSRFCSVGFLGERSVIHRSFGQKSSKLKHQRANTCGRTMSCCVSLPLSLYKGPCTGAEAPTWLECVGTRGGRVLLG